MQVLPTETLQGIFSYLSGCNSCNRVCSQWRSAFSGEGGVQLWKSYVESDFLSVAVWRTLLMNMIYDCIDYRQRPQTQTETESTQPLNTMNAKFWIPLLRFVSNNSEYGRVTSPAEDTFVMPTVNGRSLLDHIMAIREAVFTAPLTEEELLCDRYGDKEEIHTKALELQNESAVDRLSMPSEREIGWVFDVLANHPREIYMILTACKRHPVLEIIREHRDDCVPTKRQVRAFVDHVSGAHSWYKHLPYDIATEFAVFIDVNAGEVLNKDLQSWKSVTDTLHYSSYRSPDYRNMFARFSYRYASYASRKCEDISVPVTLPEWTEYIQSDRLRRYLDTFGALISCSCSNGNDTYSGVPSAADIEEYHNEILQCFETGAQNPDDSRLAIGKVIGAVVGGDYGRHPKLNYPAWFASIAVAPLTAVVHEYFNSFYRHARARFAYGSASDKLTPYCTPSESFMSALTAGKADQDSFETDSAVLAAFRIERARQRRGLLRAAENVIAVCFDMTLKDCEDDKALEQQVAKQD